ncbi:hypothetical protein [Anaerolinea sp.]|uniref:hypothetical protein n=1 Tax=Anaerolinea sp. TaxID=1872519 RepID=UPI002ACD2175|nr:hypothetical protein [Anaerolinea sp.]
MVALHTLISLSEAARKYGLEENHLRALVEKGNIRAGVIAGEMVVSEDEVRDQAVIRKEDLPEYKKHTHLKGKPIWISDAERKYRIPNPTIWRWMKSGIIARLEMGGNKTLLDEAGVAYCTEIYHSRNPKQGRQLFDDRGLPYKPKAGPLAL